MLTQRIYGIDLLRICSMLGVVVLHILGHGNVLETTNSNLGYTIVWLMEIIAYPAVNCFVLISGFVGFKGEKYYPKFNNILSLFFTVIFYSIIICLIFKFACPDMIGKKDFLKACFPVLSKQYWFFSAYVLMILSSPMLNLFVQKADSKMLCLTACITVAFTILSEFSLIDFDSGYSFIWFFMLYLLGATIKKEKLFSKISTGKTLCLVLSSVLITCITKILFHFINVDIGIIDENMFVSYCSISMLVCSIGLVLLFAKIKVNNITKSVLKFFTPTVFSVYLIHDNRFVRDILIRYRFEFINDFNEVSIIFIVLFIALLIFIACSLIDHLRIFVFRVLRIESFIEKIGSFINTKIRKT